jgi:apolipoprotein N-acyltransferase
VTHSGLYSFTQYPRNRATAFFVGAILVTAFAPLGWHWVAPLALAGLLILIDKTDSRQAAWTGFAFGTGLFIAGTWWLYISLNILGGLRPPLAVLLMLALVLAMASYSAVAAYLVVRLSPLSGWLRWLLVFPAVWTLTEWLRGWVLTGFPWMSIGYSQTDSPLGAVAPVAGVYGVTWLTALCAGLLVMAVCSTARQRFRQGLIALVGLACLVGLALLLDDHNWTEATEQELRVRLVQGAVPQERKWLAEELQPTLDLYQELSASDAPLDLLVWPEAAIPALPFEVTDFLETLHAELVERDTQLFAGMLTFDPDKDIFLNTLWALGAEEGQYHKRHLVPFGEYFPVPDFVRDLMRLMNLPSENVSVGEPQQAPLYAKGVPVAPTICYEIAYGSEQLGFFPEAQLLVNVSNDAWFGDTIAPHQHLQINRFRAREVGRYMLRATNTGITAVIDPEGQVVAQIPQFVPGAVNAVVRPHTGTTPYMQFGNWLVVSWMLLLLLAGAMAERHRKPGSIQADVS